MAKHCSYHRQNDRTLHCSLNTPHRYSVHSPTPRFLCACIIGSGASPIDTTGDEDEAMEGKPPRIKPVHKDEVALETLASPAPLFPYRNGKKARRMAPYTQLIDEKRLLELPKRLKLKAADVPLTKP